MNICYVCGEVVVGRHYWVQGLDSEMHKAHIDCAERYWTKHGKANPPKRKGLYER